MCAIVSVDVKPLNVALTCNVWAVGSRITVASPVPGEATGGTSFAPERLPTNVIGTAWAAGVCSIRAPIRTNAGERYLISALLMLVDYLPDERPDRPLHSLMLSRFRWQHNRNR